MSRFFAKLTQHNDQWAVNLLEFDGAVLTQRVTVSGEQSTPYSDLVYYARSGNLTFVCGNAKESFRMHEITEQVGRKLIEPRNWANLCHGLKIRSEVTLAWLAARGIKR